MRTGQLPENMEHLELEGPRAHWPSVERKARVLLVAVNVPGYYSLPVRILALVANASRHLPARFDTRFTEWDSREQLDAWLESVTRWRPDILALSANIWNRDTCIRLAEEVKKRLPETVVLVGGQEVTNSVIDYLQQVQAFDYIIDGEGEIPFRQFLDAWDPATRQLRGVARVSGLRYRDGKQTRLTSAAQLVSSLEEVPSAILAGLVPVHGKDKLGAMLEGARGCPFRCSFCFEGAKRSAVRMASLDRLTREAHYMASRGATYFHMMDPILCHGNPERLRKVAELFASLQEANNQTTFSVEAYGDHITDEIAECLKVCTMVDIGLQTTNAPTVEAIHRRFSPTKFREGVARLRRVGAKVNIYLISGLPYETALTFLRSVRFAVDERPTRIFLNELCLLNGTELRWRADEFGYRYDHSPPYRVRETKWMSHRDLAVVQALSKDLERRYNLSFPALFRASPWIPSDVERPHTTIRADLSSGCSRQCPGCSIEANPPPLEAKRVSELADRAANGNVELIIGDKVDGRHLIQHLGQFQLAGAISMKVVAPPALFGDAQLLHKLVSGGVWHFKTFISDADFAAEGQIVPSGADLGRLSVGLRTLSRPFALPGRSEIRPYVEVVVMAGACRTGSVRDMVRWAAEHRASAVTVAAVENARLNDEWMQEMAAAFYEAVESRYWLKLPRRVVARVLAEMESLQEVVDHLTALGLTGDESDKPPCFHAKNTTTLAQAHGG